MLERMATAISEVKFAGEADEMSFEGYGAHFNNVDAYGDVIEPGAFAKSLAAHKAAGTAPLMLLEHGFSAAPLPVGVWEEMSEDGKGLRVKGRLLPTTDGRDTYIALKAGAINGLSIGYRVTEHVMRSNPEDPRRRIKAADLVEVSIVAMPANGLARVQAVKAMAGKTADELKAEITRLSDLGDLLREAAGWSRSQTEAVLSNFQAKAARGEPGGDEAILAAAERLLKSLNH